MGKSDGRRKLRTVGIVVAVGAAIVGAIGLAQAAASMMSRSAVDDAMRGGTADQAYVVDNADVSLAGTSDAAIPRDMMTVSNLMVEEGALPEGQRSIDGLWGTDEDGDGLADNWAAVLGETHNKVMLYELDPDSDYYVAYATTAAGDGNRPVDWLAGYNDTSGTTYDDVVYDEETGLVYVPKSYTARDEGGTLCLNATRVQFMYEVPADGETDVTVRVHDNGKSSVGTQRLSLFDPCCEVEVGDIRSDDVDAVFANGAEFPREAWEVEDGRLTLRASPASVGSIEVVTSRSLAKSAASVLSATVAWAYQLSTPNDVGGTWTFSSTPQAGDTFRITTSSIAYFGSDPGVGADPAFSWQEHDYGSQEEIFTRAILNGDLGYLNTTPYWVLSSSGDQESAARVGEGTFTTASGNKVAVQAFGVDLICAHLGVSRTDFSVKDSGYTNQWPYDHDYGNGNWADEDLFCRIAKVSGDIVVFGIVQPSLAGQSGAGLFSVHYQSSGTLKLVKSSASPASTDGDSWYELSGAAYGVFSDQACSNRVGLLTTRADGSSNETLTLDVGTYYVKEEAAPQGFALDETVHAVNVSAGQENVCNVADEPLARLSLVKSSANASVTDGNSCYSLKDAVYGVYGDAACSSRVGQLTTRADGSSNETLTLPVGTYYVKEEAAPQGYAEDGEVHKVDLAAGPVHVCSVSDVPLDDPLQLRVSKVDAEGGAVAMSPQGSATLEGAQFTICYYDGYYDSATTLPSEPKRAWVIQTVYDAEYDVVYADMDNDACHVSGDEYYYNEVGWEIIPIGTITIQETKAPAGYQLTDSSLHIRQYVPDSSAASGVRIVDVTEWSRNYTALDEDHVAIEDQVSRGDITFRKHEQSGASMAGVAFLITSLSTGESHVIVTDDNGMASTASDWVAHSEDTNGNDASVTVTADGEEMSLAAYSRARMSGASFDEVGFVVDDGMLDAGRGVWFGLETTSDGNIVTTGANDERGALPYDRESDGGGYELRELASGATAGHSLVTDTFTIARNDREIDLGTYDDAPVKILTELTAADGRHVAQAAESLTLTDKVSYFGLVPGTAYRLHGELHRISEAGEDLGVIAESDLDLTPQADQGFVDVAFELAAPALGADHIVATEELRQGSAVIAKHEDLGDEGQTVWFPSIGTGIVSETTGGHDAAASAGQALIDTVSYEGLAVGQEYTLEGRLMDRADGSEVAQAGVTFTPDAGEGTVEVAFAVDASRYSGHDLVAYERLYGPDGSLWARHEDLDDEAQTIHVPHIGTTAAAAGPDGFLPAYGGRIVDLVTYTNLLPETSYALTGRMHLAGKAEDGSISDEGAVGEAVTVEFVTPVGEDGASTVSGTVNVAFDVSGDGIDGRSLVAFETLTRSDVTLASHADIADPAQTIKVPSIGTTASTEAGRVVFAGPKQGIVDTVSYVNLVPGIEYTVSGTVHVAEADSDGTWKDAGAIRRGDGSEVAASATFTPESPSGSVEVAFRDVDLTNYAGARLVVFESLAVGDTEIAGHADIADEAQTVFVPSIGTTLVGPDGTHRCSSSGKATLTDTVAYEGLTPGVEYTIEGTLHIRDAKGGDAGIARDGTGGEATAQATFTPEGPSGTAQVAFEVDAASNDGRTLVAFERVLKDGIVVAEHADIRDDAQSVAMSQTTMPQTGAGPGPWIAIGAAGLMAAAAAALLRHKPKSGRRGIVEG